MGTEGRATMKRRPSVMKHKFSEVPKAEIPRSTFDRSHGHKTTFDASYLIPVFVDEGLPGDTFKVRMTGFARLATPIFPIMDNMMMDVHFFAVPMRLVWDKWEKFNGEQDNPGDSTDFLIPQMTETAAADSLSDYMGIPTGVQLTHSALWHRAYNLIYNQWYRPQDIIDSVPVNRGDGPDNPADYVLLKRAKRHDYFTAALPWPQKGPGVMIPLGDTAPVVSSGVPMGVAGSAGGTGGALYATVTTNNVSVNYAAATGPLYAAGASGLEVDLAQASAATINSLRQAFQIQKIYERDARGGTRYIEILKSHFGVTSPDARLQRAEYLGGGSTMVNIAPVAQTSATPTQTGTEAATPQGNLAGFGTAVTNGVGFTASFTEHVLILGIVSVRADLTYQEGLARMWSRKTRFDFYWPALAHIGEQAILNKEIYAQGTAADEDVFGYQERHAEYRYKPSIITGRFRSQHPQSLDSWHLSQDFAALPVLDKTFIEENVPLDRCIAVTDEPHFLFDSFFSMHCARPMPVYGVPGLIDHF